MKSDRKYSYIDIKKEYIKGELFEYIYAFYWENGEKDFDKFENKDYYLFVSPDSLKNIDRSDFIVEKGEYTTITGEKCIKISPKKKLNAEEFRTFRGRFKQTYESDVQALTRWICNNKPQYDKNVRLLYLDIETLKKDGEYGSAADPFSPIAMITTYDNFTKEYHTFYWKDEHPSKPHLGLVHVYDTESRMLVAFSKYLDTIEPDYLLGWNIESFDVPYILARTDRLKMDKNGYSPLNRVTYRQTHEVTQYKFSSYYVNITGMGVFDLMSAAQRRWLGKHCGYSLEKMSAHHLKDHKIKIRDIDDAYYNRLDELIDYNIQDVKLCVDLDNKLELVKGFQDFQEIMSVNLETTLVHTNLTYFSLWQHTDRVLLNSDLKGAERETEGAVVLDTIPGVHYNCLKFDLVSDYPTIIMDYNISPETILDKWEPGCISMDGKYFFRREPGIIPQVVRDYFTRRIYYKKQGNKSLSLAYKYLMNIPFGQFGGRYSRMYAPIGTEAILYQGRRILNHLKNDIEERLGARVILGDTDSIVVDSDDPKAVERVLKISEDMFDYFYKKDGITTKRMAKLELEKTVNKLLIFSLEGKSLKKKYVQYIEGEEPVNVGMDLMKRDTPEIAKDLQRDIIELFKEEVTKRDLDLLLLSYRKNFNEAIKEKNYELIGIPSKLNRSEEDYKMKTFALRGIDNAKLSIGINEVFYVIQTMHGPLAFKTNYDEHLRKDIKIDSAYMWERIERKARIFYGLLGLSDINLYQEELF